MPPPSPRQERVHRTQQCPTACAWPEAPHSLSREASTREPGPRLQEQRCLGPEQMVPLPTCPACHVTRLATRGGQCPSTVPGLQLETLPRPAWLPTSKGDPKGKAAPGMPLGRTRRRHPEEAGHQEAGSAGHKAGQGRRGHQGQGCGGQQGPHSWARRCGLARMRQLPGGDRTREARTLEGASGGRAAVGAGSP